MYVAYASRSQATTEGSQDRNPKQKPHRDTACQSTLWMVTGSCLANFPTQLIPENGKWYCHNQENPLHVHMSDKKSYLLNGDFIFEVTVGMSS